ncbi:hypothetical protein [Bradyrhizobium sp. SZCCHNRI1009]|uniref:hypothetical protein n=1 Tax=Bradyrhizobium sp. SZCCHNRI1009 TaxID=3057277 RepID=UPI0029169AB0|nr:hypothetical protein [Bradyrhizobium sp. SZCCHNRI1009]
MARSIAVGLVILAISTSAALAGHRTHHHARAAAVPQVGSSDSDRDEYGNMRVNPGTPGVSGSNAALHAKTHRDSRYNPKSDYNANGTMRVDTGTPGVSGSNADLHAKTHRDSGYNPKSDYNADGTIRVH